MKKNAKHLLVLFLTVCVLCAPAAGGLCPAPAAGEETTGNNAAASDTEQQQNAASPYYNPIEPDRETYIKNVTLTIRDNTFDLKIRNILENQGVQPFTETAIAPDGTFGQTAPINWDPDSIKNATIEVTTFDITDPLQNNFSPPNGYPANRVIAGMAGTLPQAKLADDEAVVPLTVDNFWIADRKPASEEEKKNQPKVILGRNRGSELTVNGEATGDDLDKAKALIATAEASIRTATGILGKLQDENNQKKLQKAINEASEFVAQAKNATDDELLGILQQKGYEFLNTAAKAPAVLAGTLYAGEKGTLDAENLQETLGIKTEDLTAFAARSGFTLEDLISFFSEKKLTPADFVDMMNELEASNYTIQDFIEAGVLDNEGVAGLVVRLTDTPEGIQARYTSASGTTYQFCGAVVLSNGKQLQFGDPMNKENTKQQFGPVDMDGKGTTCFFSTVYSEALGLFPGEMIISRYMLIQGTDGKPLLYWFDETGAPSVIGPLDQVDPDKSIAKLFDDAGYADGLPLELDKNSIPTGYQYLTHSLQYTVEQAPTCVRAGIELITCANCKLSLARELPAVGHRLTAHEQVDPTCTETGTEAYWSCYRCGKLFSDARARTEINKPVEIAKDPAAHPEGKLTETPAKAATCAAAGNSAYWTCSECGKYFSDAQGKTEIEKDSWVIAKDPAAHPEGKLTETPAQAATCTSAGNSAYWTCYECGKYFSDAQGKTEIEKDSWVIAKDPAAHPEGKLTETPAKAATCTEDGYSAYWSCSECNKLFSDAQGKNEIEAPVPIAAGHLWGQPSWEWTSGLSSAKATFTCTRNSSHTHTETDTAPVRIDSESSPATMDAPGKEVYQATVKIDGTGAEYTDKQEKTLRLTPYVSGSPLTEISAEVDETVGARLNLCFSDCRLTYSDGTRTDDEIQYSLRYSINSGTITTSTPSTDVKGQSFSVTVTFTPTEKSNIYESVTGTYSITITE